MPYCKWQEAEKTLIKLTLTKKQQRLNINEKIKKILEKNKFFQKIYFFNPNIYISGSLGI